MMRAPKTYREWSVLVGFLVFVVTLILATKAIAPNDAPKCCVDEVGKKVCPCQAASAQVGVAHWSPPFSATNKLSVIDTERTIAHVKGGVVVFGTATKHPSRLFIEDKPWEPRIDNGYPNVHYEPSARPPFRLWYDCCIEVEKKHICRGADLKGLLYAESDDGVVWRKPSLGLVDFHGSKENNIVLKGTHGLGVFRDPHEEDPSKIFKAFGEFHRSKISKVDIASRATLKTVLAHLEEDGTQLWFHSPLEIAGKHMEPSDFVVKYLPLKAIEQDFPWDTLRTKAELEALPLPIRLMIQHKSKGGVATSADGLHWSDFRALQLHNRFDTHNWMYWDSKKKEYVGITRGTTRTARGELNRTVMRFALDEWDGSPRSAKLVYAGTTLHEQPYTVKVVPFYNIYLGFVNTYDADLDWKKGRFDDKVRCELLWSPDSFHWHLLHHEGRTQHASELIVTGLDPAERHDAFDCFYANPVVVGNEVWMYYMGGDGPHMSYRNTSFNLARLRMDGFAGLAPRSIDGKATVVTKVLRCHGQGLLVTADVADGGHVKVSVTKDTGDAIPHRGLSDSIPLRHSATDHRMEWQGATELSHPSQCILTFELVGAVLYTFGWTHPS